LAALNIQDLQYYFRVSKTLERQGNYIANRDGCGVAKHYPCPDFLLLARASKRALCAMMHSGLMLRVSLCA